MKKYALIILIIISSSLFAQNSVDSLKIIKNKIELELLEQRNQDLLNFQDKLSATIYWSLGFSATFLILFLGINIYFLRNRYNEDKERFLKQIEDTLTIKSKELESILTDTIDKVIESKLSGINSNINSIELTHQSLAIENKRNGIELAKLKKESDALILLYYFQLAVEMKNSKYGLYERDIADIIAEMEKLIDKGAKFIPSVFTDVTNLLDSLPSQFADVVHKFREKLRKNSV